MKNMKVILREDVEHLGHMGDTVLVTAGYANNFLIPRKFAVIADSATANQIEHEMRIIKRRDEKRRKEFKAVRDRVEGIRLELLARAGEDGKLFGSVTSFHLSDKLAQLGHTIDRRNIVLKEPLKSLGDHDVIIRMTKGIEAKILVRISAENAAELEAMKAERQADEKKEIEQDLAFKDDDE